jgi:hypothetical protein
MLLLSLRVTNKNKGIIWLRKGLFKANYKKEV